MNTPDNIPLKDCPFCGAQFTVKQGVIESDSKVALDHRFEIMCGDCFASGPDAKSEEQAVERWNTRHASSVVAKWATTEGKTRFGSPVDHLRDLAEMVQPTEKQSPVEGDLVALKQ